MGLLDKAFSGAFSFNLHKNYVVDAVTPFHRILKAGPNAINPSKPDTALKLSAVWNAVDILSNDIAKIPFSVYQDTSAGKIKITDHPVSKLLKRGPKIYITSFIERKTMAISLLLRGNSLSKIITNSRGEVVSLEFINWDDVVDIYKYEDTLVYKLKNGAMLLAEEVVHLKWFTFNGIVGTSVITYAAKNLGLAIEVQEFSATNFENKGVMRGVVETEKTLTTKEAPNKKAEIRNAIQAAFADKDPARLAILDDGLKYKSITITPQDLQIIEQARFSIEDIARWFNINLNKIKSLQQSTNNNIEQQSLDHVGDSIQPLLQNWEEEYTKKLLSTKELDDNFYVKGNIRVLLRADIKSQAEFYSKMVQVGVYTRNEIRDYEEKNPLPGLDEPLTPVNTQTTSQIQNSLENE